MSLTVRPWPRHLRVLLLVVAVMLALVSGVSAQRFFGLLGDDVPVRNLPYDGRFTFARLKYDVGPGGYYYRGLPAWAHGYNRGEENLTRILEAISAVRPHLDGSNVFSLDDPDLMKYPVAYMTEAGYWEMSDGEAAAFRAYLLKGGFVIFDDFRPPPRGGEGWQQFERNMRRVLPTAEIVELHPTDPIFHSFFDINSFDIIPQAYDGGEPLLEGVYDSRDPMHRLLAVVNFNTDVSQFWEFSDTGLSAVDPNNEAYKLGVNYIIYGLTH